LDAKPAATEQDHSAWTDRVIAAIGRDGHAFFSGTTWRGRRAMRVSVSNWQTSGEDIDRTIASIARVLDGHRPSSR
jgi:hypothetical protein